MACRHCTGDVAVMSRADGGSPYDQRMNNLGLLLCAFLIGCGGGSDDVCNLGDCVCPVGGGCTVDCPDGLNCHVQGGAGSKVDVDCAGAVECNVECSNADTCDVACAGGDCD